MAFITPIGQDKPDVYLLFKRKLKITGAVNLN
jgi:hypothetical protein